MTLVTPAAQADTFSYERDVPDLLRAMAAVETAIAAHGLDRNLMHLMKLRASQINRCAFCVKMHTREARHDGETDARLDRLVVFAQVSDYSERETAALAWTEALTVLDPNADLAPLRARLRQHFTDKEIGALTSAIAMINLWNRIQISRH